MDFTNIKLIVSEFDGIVTDGTSAVDSCGFTVMKNIYMPDIEAINVIKSKGYTFVFLSNDNNITYTFLRSKNIPFFWAQTDKVQTLSKILQKYSCTPDNLLYIGSKLSDYKCFDLAAYSFCPDSTVKPRANTVVLPIKSGCGVLTHVLSMLPFGEI